MINCDELSKVDGSNHNYHATADILKSRATEPFIDIEVKGSKKFNYPDYMNLLLTTNNDFVLKIEQGDARYFITECSPVHKGDRNYFNKLGTSLTQESADHFFSYVSYFDGVDDIRDDIPMTNLKKSMMINSLSSPKQFLYRVKEVLDLKEVDEDDESWIVDLWNDEKLLKAHSLYCYYSRFCSAENEKVFSLTKFGREIGSMIEKKRSNGILYDLNTIKE